MLTLIKDLPPFAVGVTAHGEITKEDYENVMIPALKKASEEWAGINFIMVLETSIKNFTAGAWVKDLKVNMDFFLKWNKIAMVSSSEIFNSISTMSDAIIPGEVKRFCLEQLEEAKEWICAP